MEKYVMYGDRRFKVWSTHRAQCEGVFMPTTVLVTIDP